MSITDSTTTPHIHYQSKRSQKYGSIPPKKNMVLESSSENSSAEAPQSVPPQLNNFNSFTLAKQNAVCNNFGAASVSSFEVNAQNKQKQTSLAILAQRNLFSLQFNMIAPLADNDQEDEKIVSINQSIPQRIRSRTVGQNGLLFDESDLIHKFVNSQFPDSNVISRSAFRKISLDNLLKRARVLYDRANSLSAVGKFEECLNIIYVIYNLKYHSNHSVHHSMRDSQRSAVIAMHMNVVLNLAAAYELHLELGKALKMYEEAMLLYDLDCIGFRRSAVNLKAWILRGMADVCIKQREFSSALALLEEAVPLAKQSNDTLSLYQILCSQARALLDAQQLMNAQRIFEKAIVLSKQLHSDNRIALSSSDRDLYRNCGLCYSLQAKHKCTIVTVKNTKCVQNTPKSMEYWDSAAKMYKETVKITKNIYGQHSFEYIESLYEWSDVLCTKGEYDESYRLFQNIQLLFEQFDENTQKTHMHVLDKTKQMIQTLRPHVNLNTL